MAHKHIVYMMLVEAAARLEDSTTLERYLPLLEELAIRDEHQPYLAVAHRAWGVTHRHEGRFAAAAERLGQALSIFEERQMPWQTGRTRFELGRLAADQGDEAGAREQYERASVEFAQLGAKPELERVQEALASLAALFSA